MQLKKMESCGQIYPRQSAELFLKNGPPLKTSEKIDNLFFPLQKLFRNGLTWRYKKGHEKV